MKKLIYSNGLYAICQLDKKNLYELAEFVVRENYKHHDGDFSTESIREEIHAVLIPGLRSGDGGLRDRKKILPLQKLFGINPLKIIHHEKDYSYWHIGRFAIDSFAGIPTITLFKQLMVYAIHPIVCDDQSFMIAETDSKLLKVMNVLGIETIQLGHSINYLASETIPIYSSKNGLLLFYKHYENLYQSS